MLAASRSRRSSAGAAAACLDHRVPGFAQHRRSDRAYFVVVVDEQDATGRPAPAAGAMATPASPAARRTARRVIGAGQVHRHCGADAHFGRDVDAAAELVRHAQHLGQA